MNPTPPPRASSEAVSIEQAPAQQTRAVPHLFRPLCLRSVTLRNRLVVSPMCQYSCEAGDGLATEWHRVHLSTRAVGGAGLVFTEAAAVAPEGRISPQDLGIWSDAHGEVLEPIVAFAKAQGAAVGIQFAHAGRKASMVRPWERPRALADAEGGWTPMAPSPIPFGDSFRAPREMSVGDIAATVRAFAQAAERARRAGFDVIEVHAAHGYLIHEFLSPLANHRTDRYGGSFENRARLALEIVDAIRAVWPEHKPLFVRLSVTDWVAGGWDLDSSVRLAAALARHGVDLIDCSSGGLSPLQQVALEPGYQVPFAERIRRDASILTMAVGLITTAAQAEQIVAGGQADLVAMAREFLRNPYFPLHAARTLGSPDAVSWPPQYLRAR